MSVYSVYLYHYEVITNPIMMQDLIQDAAGSLPVNLYAGSNAASPAGDATVCDDASPAGVATVRDDGDATVCDDASPAGEATVRDDGDATVRDDASPAGEATDPTVSFAVLSASTPVCDNIAYALDNVLPLAVSNADELGQTVSRHRNPARNKKMHFTDSWHASPVTKVHCVCRSDLDNSRMIQCEKCYRWFHCSCLSLKQVFIYRQC
jgi:hypothetical protein